MLVALFNEWIFLRGFLSWVSGRYSVAWAQERSTRRLGGDSKTEQDTVTAQAEVGFGDDLTKRDLVRGSGKDDATTD